MFWLELLIEGNLIEPKRLNPLLDEANQLTAIFSATSKSAKNTP